MRNDGRPVAAEYQLYGTGRVFRSDPRMTLIYTKYMMKYSPIFVQFADSWPMF